MNSSTTRSSDRPRSPPRGHDWSAPAGADDGTAKSLVSVLVAVASAIFLAVMFDHRAQAPSDTYEPPPSMGPTLSETDPSYFLLNALLVPALDREAQPLRWADPRPPADCGRGTTVSVDGQPLMPGALVPVAPFELTWDARGCRPFGANGPRFEGGVRLTVFREDWGWSAIVEPADLRIALHDRTVAVTRKWATMPQWIDPLEPAGPAVNGD